MVQKTQAVRRNDIDWLRILAVLLLVPFHSSLIFVLDPNSIMYIKDTVNSGLLNHAESFIHQFHMPLLFTLSGASTCLALNFRSGAQYLQERVTRLFIPAVFGVVVLVPPMTYITRMARGENISFWVHYQGFFKINPSDLAGYYGTLTPAHLWFIIFLFVFSIVGLPLFLLMRSGNSKNFVQALARFFEHRFTLFLLVVPIAFAASLDLLGDKNPLVYFLFFFIGFLLMTDEGYQRAIDRDAPIALVLGIIFMIIHQTYHPEYSDWSLPWILFGLMETLNRWVWVLAFLGLGHRFLNHRSSILSYLSEAAFPFYILHLLFNTLTGYFIIKLNAGIAVKYILIVLITTLVVYMIYEIIRRIPPLRFLLGMKIPGAKSIVPQKMQIEKSK